MNKLISRYFLMLFCIAGCAKKSIQSYDFSDFLGSTFVSTTKQDGNYSSISFIKPDIIEIKNLPNGGELKSQFSILKADESPSGEPTVGVNARRYFIIKNKNTLIYHYSVSSHWEEVIFKRIK